MKIQELMTAQVVTIAPEESAALAARLLTRHSLGALPVCDHKGHLLGIVTDRDIITRCVAAGQDPKRVTAAEIMSRGVETISPEEDIHAAAKRMGEHQVRRLPVIEGKKLVGMVSLGDLAARRKWESEAAEALGEISVNLRHGNSMHNS